MESNNNSRRRNRNRSNRAPRNDPTVVTLKQIKDLIQNQNTKATPGTKDVIWPTIREGKIHVFVDSYTLPVVATNGAIPTAVALSFNLASGGQSSSITTLFDCYRIRMIKVTFSPLPNNPVNQQGPLYTVIDHDDAVTPTLASITQYSNLQETPAGQYTERVFVPNTANPVYSGTAFTDYARTPNSAWIDAANPGSLYYGLKYFVPVGAVAANLWAVTVHMLIEAKDTR